VISVVIATYNHGRFIREAVDSVLAQGVPGSELIVVDDGSTDGTAALLAPYGDRLRAIRQENRGFGAARNTGARAARGALIGFLDADDVWEPGAIARLERALEDDPRTGLAASTYVTVDEEGRAVGTPYRRRAPRRPVSTESLLLTDADVPGCLYRRETLEAVGPFPEATRYTVDYEMWLRVSMSWRIVVIDEPLLRKRAHATNLSNEALRMLPAKIASVERFAAEHPAWAAGHARLLRRAQAKNHERIARWCLRSGDPAHRAPAREHAARAVALDPWRAKPYLLGARAWLR